MTSLQSIKKRPYLLTALIVAAAIGIGFALSAPFFLTRSGRGFDGRMIRQIPATHDLIQHIAVMDDFDKVLRHGTLYPRWLPDVNGGYGLPWMNDYPPGFYYLTSLLHTIDSDWINILFIASVLGFAASGLAFYLVARLFYSRLASALAGVLYMALPIHVTEVYWRGAMPQFMGYIFLPLVLYFGYTAGAFGKAGHYAGLALCIRRLFDDTRADSSADVIRYGALRNCLGLSTARLEDRAAHRRRHGNRAPAGGHLPGSGGS